MQHFFGKIFEKVTRYVTKYGKRFAFTAEKQKKEGRARNLARIASNKGGG